MKKKNVALRISGKQQWLKARRSLKLNGQEPLKNNIRLNKRDRKKEVWIKNPNF